MNHHPLLSATGLRRSFGALVAVADVDLHLHPGDRHAIIGPNGAGKTTLINLIAGMLRPAAGHLRLAGRDITYLPPARRSRLGIARTFQTPAVCASLTVLEHMLLGGWHHRTAAHLPRSPSRRHRSLAARGHHLLDQLGIAHLAGHRAATLSHGQQRLLEIGLALAAAPRLLLLDEPAAGLADHDLPLLRNALSTLPDHVTVLLVEHDLDLVTTLAGAVTVLHHGAVLATGTPAQVLHHRQVAQAYLGQGTR